MYKRTIALGLAAAAVTTMVAVPTFANGYGWGERSGERPAQPTQEMIEHREAIADAVESGDYNAWLEAVGERPCAEQVTADEFSRYQEMHRLRQQGRELMEEANEIAEEIGLERPNRSERSRRGFMKGAKRGFQMGRHFEAAQPTN